MGREDEGFAAVYRAALAAARRLTIHDPAIDAEDVAQEAWLRSVRWLDGGRPEHEQVAYLRAAVRSVGIDHIRRAGRHGGAPVPLDAPHLGAGDEWITPGEIVAAPGSVEGEALARLELAEVAGAAAGGDALALAALLMGMGHTRDEIGRAWGVAGVTVSTRAHRYRAARAGEVTA